MKDYNSDVSFMKYFFKKGNKNSEKLEEAGRHLSYGIYYTAQRITVQKLNLIMVHSYILPELLLPGN